MINCCFLTDLRNEELYKMHIFRDEEKERHLHVVSMLAFLSFILKIHSQAIPWLWCFQMYV